MKFLGILIAAAVFGSHGAQAGGNSEEPATANRAEQARNLVQQFVGELKPRLQKAMAEGGPAHAIGVCAEVAPALMDDLSAESGWAVRRVSLQPRNTGRAVPDEWERDILTRFAEQQAAGTPAGELRHAAVQGERFRYMQAQATEGLCLACHGEDLSPEVVKALQIHYPEDQATGYQAGQVRGAISLIAPAS